MKWIFEGIGTELLSLAIGAIFGGIAGYKIGVKNKVKQNQKAGRESTQNQIGSVMINGK